VRSRRGAVHGLVTTSPLSPSPDGEKVPLFIPLKEASWRARLPHARRSIEGRRGDHDGAAAHETTDRRGR
jgi:hypothetical protein